jgi:signal recognition particle GTPase
MPEFKFTMNEMRRYADPNDPYTPVEMPNFNMNDGILDNLPAEAKEDAEDITRKRMRAFTRIIDAMTDAERENPEQIDADQVEWIADAAGEDKELVWELLQQFKLTKKTIEDLREEEPKFVDIDVDQEQRPE